MSWNTVFRQQEQNTSNVSPNKKGEGFRFFNAPTDRKTLKKQAIFGTITGLIGLSVISTLISKHATPDFIILTGALMTLCSLTLYGVLSRQIQDNDITDRLDTLTKDHDRLVRDVARNRNEITMLKDGTKAIVTAPQKQDSKTPSPILDLENKIPPLRAMPPSMRNKGKKKEKAFSDTVIIELLNHAIENNEVDIFMQPVVSLPQRRLQFYEIYTKIHAGKGQYVSGRDYFDVANDWDLLQDLDKTKLIHTLTLLLNKRVKGSDITPFMINIAVKTLLDRGFMNNLLPFLAKYNSMSKRIVFEVSQADISKADDRVKSIFKALSKLGCQFSMDSIRNPQIDIDTLKEFCIRYIKLDARWALHESKTDAGFVRLDRLKATLKDEGIEMIIEKIETETQLRNLLDISADYGQGYLFSKPSQSAAFMKLPDTPSPLRRKRASNTNAAFS